MTRTKLAEVMEAGGYAAGHIPGTGSSFSMYGGLPGSGRLQAATLADRLQQGYVVWVDETPHAQGITDAARPLNLEERP